MCQKGKCYDFLGKGVITCVFFWHFVAVEIHRGVGVVGAGRRGTLRPAMANSSSSSTTELGSHKLVLVRACRTRTITRHGPPSFPMPQSTVSGPRIGRGIDAWGSGCCVGAWRRLRDGKMLTCPHALTTK